MDPTNRAVDNDLQVDLQAAQAMHKFHAEGDVRAVHLLATRLAVQPRSRPLADLVRMINGQTATRPPTDSGTLDAASATDKAAAQAELKTV